LPIGTMLVATLGLLPAALSHAIGSDSQRTFAIVIVGGLIASLVMNIFLLPTFYAWWARPTDHLPPSEEAKSLYAYTLATQKLVRFGIRRGKSPIIVTLISLTRSSLP